MSGLDPRVVDVLRRTVEAVAAGRPIRLDGAMISAADVVSPTFLLPALMVRASELHAIARAAGAPGAFHVDLRSDRSAVLGVRVEHLEATSLQAVALPVASIMRDAGPEGVAEISMNGTVRAFGEWLALNGQVPQVVAEPDMGPRPGG